MDLKKKGQGINGVWGQEGPHRYCSEKSYLMAALESSEAQRVSQCVHNGEPMTLISMGVMYSKQLISQEKSRFSESHRAGSNPSFATNSDYVNLGWLQSLPVPVSSPIN